MSYPFTLRFLTGKLLIDNEELEKFMIMQGELGPLGKDDEIWSTDENAGLAMVEFTIKANEFSYEPEITIIRALSYVWTSRDGIKNLLKGLDQDLNKIGLDRPDRSKTYQCYFILGKRPPPGVVSGLTKRIGRTTLLERGLRELPNFTTNLERNNQNSKFFWCIVLGPNNAKETKQKLKYDLSDSLGSFAEKMDKAESARVVLGESISTNCAEVCVNF
jgi:hypothetical protein